MCWISVSVTPVIEGLTVCGARRFSMPLRLQSPGVLRGEGR
jgi:hypothetical protein